jgi:tetraacyldisaccharide 4'-kinase
VLSGRRAWEEFHPDACILDDAFQYWRMEKDLEIVLVNAVNPFGFGHLLPRGMLREPLRGLRRAHAAVITHASSVSEEVRERIRTQLARWNPELVIAEARHTAARLRDHATGSELPVDALAEGKWAALCGLGQPESFERSLQELGARGAISLRFPDHYQYLRADLEQAREAVRAGRLAGIVTTEKDAVKIPADWLGDTRCLVLEVDLELLSGDEALSGRVRDVLRRSPSAREAHA